MVQRQDVEFAAEGGVTLRGWLFVPDGPGSAPGHHDGPRVRRGKGARTGAIRPGVRRRGICGPGARPPRLRRQRRIAALRHRPVGADRRLAPGDLLLGEPPCVDADRIGLWGSSYAGGHAIVLGATDRRLRAVVAQVPTISGYQQSLRRVAPDQVPALEAAFADDERRQFHGAPPATQAVVSADPSVPAAYRAPDAIAFYNQPVPEGVWDNVVTLRSTRAARMYEPGTWIARVSPTPLLMVVGLHDTITVTDLALAAYEKALQPKKLVTIDGGHFDPYLTRFAEASGAATAWFTEHLTNPKTTESRKEYAMSELHYEVLVNDGLRRHREQTPARRQPDHLLAGRLHVDLRRTRRRTGRPAVHLRAGAAASATGSSAPAST